MSSSTVDLKTKEEKDAELDKRIEALRKKNEALMKRYQEIEEDKKKAEQEGIAVTTPRKPRPHEPKMEKENFTVTVDLSKATGVRDQVELNILWTPGGMDRKSKEWEEKRRQNIEKMNEEMERIAEYERGQRQDGDKPTRNFLDDPRRSGPAPDTDRKEGSRRHVRNWGGLDFDNVKTGSELEKEWTSRRPGPKGSMDMTMSMTGRERAEYLRWKKEREQIDEERLARHRNATGQWRREWDAQKTDNIFYSETFHSMHDNRWEGEKEEEKEEKEKEKEEKEKEKEDKTKKEEKKGEDDDEWEDASDDGDYEVVSDSEQDSKGDEKKDIGKEKQAKSKESSPKTPKPRSRQTSAGSPKDQRTPRPKVHIPPPAAAQESPEGGKPLSPFSPLDGHKPVSDWGEEMELMSPRSSMGGESPPKPSSVDSSPPQKKEEEEQQEEEIKSQAASSSEPAESQSEEHADSPTALPSDPAPCEVKVDEDTPPAPSQGNKKN
uniref:Coiled-coil domain containing 9 n=1 Tax=Neolamprologus brichardi TaxID=32507 RepID=A0A3Q4HGK0_NEOBR